MSFATVLSRARYRYFPEHQIGELLLKPWIDTAIPAALLLFAFATFGVLVPDFFTAGNLSDTARQLGEIGFLTLGLMVVILSGGIDLSVGAIYGLANFAAIAALRGFHLPVMAALLVALVVGGAIGLVNGVLVGILKMRAFLSTLAMLIIGRSVQEMLALHYGASLLTDPGDLDLWYWFGDGSIFGVPVSLAMLLLAGASTHLLLTRMSLGWRIQAVGGSRRSAYNIGLEVSTTIAFCYFFSGLCAGMAGFLYSARVANPGAVVGVGLEIVVLTAAILGGNSLGGGRGSASKAVLGSLIVILIINSLVAMGLRSGATNFVLGLALLCAVLIDVHWAKNKHKLLARVYVSPTYFDPLPLPSIRPDDQTAFAINHLPSNAAPIGLDKLDGPEDVIFDSKDYLYTVSRAGDIVRFSPPDYLEPEIFAHIGGQTLGIAMDANDTIHVCVSGMGLYAVDRDRTVKKLSDQVPRSLFSIRDDSRVRFARDLDIAPDGRVFFSEATARFDIHDWAADSLEMRGNGRLLVYDPRTGKTEVALRDLIFPNGVCVEANGLSVLVAETWPCWVSRYWFDGPRKGHFERVIENLPGFAGNINRSSDGNYWLALLGVRTPLHDLAMQMPGFRKRMAQRVAYDEWLYPNFNAGLLVKVSESGEILDCLWDGEGQRHTTLTSMCEHRGYLYLGGIFNNRIGRIRLPGANPNWTMNQSYWGPMLCS
jgi:ribose transport system permease protein